MSQYQETEASTDATTAAPMQGFWPKRSLMALLLAKAPQQDLPLPDRKPLRRRAF